MRTPLHLFCCWLVGILAIPGAANAQFRGDGTQLTQITFPVEPLDSLPPIRVGMPSECLDGYRFIDSIARNIDLGQFPYRHVRRDTLRSVLRRVYAVNDYDPHLASRYFVETNRRPFMQSYPGNVYFGARIAMAERIEEFGEPIVKLLMADYIVRVHVNNVVDGLDTTYPSNPKRWINVSVDILETIKGRRRPLTCALDASDPALPTCLNFGYAKYQTTGMDYSDVQMRKSWLPTAAPGEEFFLLLDQVAFDRTIDYIIPSRFLDSAGGMYRIIDGRVQDSSNFWGAGTSPTIAEFRERLQTLIGEIKGWRLPSEISGVTAEPEGDAGIALTASFDRQGDRIVVRYDRSASHGADLELIDIAGYVVGRLPRSGGSADTGRSSFEVAELPAGNYLVVLSVNGKCYSTKVAVAR